MRRPGGYIRISDPEKPLFEQDTFTCKHCNAIVPVKPRQDPSEMGGFCRLCYGHICKRCSIVGSCTPFEKKVEDIERKDRNYRAILGLK